MVIAVILSKLVRRLKKFLKKNMDKMNKRNKKLEIKNFIFSFWEYKQREKLNKIHKS